MSPSVREYRRQESQYVRLTVSYLNGAFVLPASLPAGALITSLLVLVETAFSAGASMCSAPPRAATTSRPPATPP